MIPKITQNTFGIIQYGDLYASFTTQGWKSGDPGFEEALNKMSETYLSQSIGYIPLQNIAMIQEIARMAGATIVYLASESELIPDRVY